MEKQYSLGFDVLSTESNIFDGIPYCDSATYPFYMKVTQVMK